MYGLMDELNAGLSEKFFDDLIQNYTDKRQKHEILNLYKKYHNVEENMMVQLVNLVDRMLIEFPEFLDKKGSDKFLTTLTEDYLNHLSDQHLLAYPHKVNGSVDVNLKSILNSDTKKKNFNDRIVKIIQTECESMETQVTLPKYSNLVIALQDIDIRHVDTSEYLKVLTQVTNAACISYKNDFTLNVIKDISVQLSFSKNLHSVKTNDRLIEIRDTILALMEMHHCPDIACLLNTHQNPENPFNTLANPILFRSYLEFVSTYFAIDAIRIKGDDKFFDSQNEINIFQIYRYLYDPKVVNYVLFDTGELEYESIFHSTKKGWSRDYVKYILSEIDKEISQRVIFKIRNSLFLKVSRLFKMLNLNNKVQSEVQMSEAFQTEIEMLDKDLEDLEGLLSDDSDQEQTMIIENTNEEYDPSKDTFEGTEHKLFIKGNYKSIQNDLDHLLDLVNIQINSPYTNGITGLCILKDVLEVLSKVDEVQDLDYKLLMSSNSTYQKFESICFNLDKLKLNNSEAVESLDIAGSKKISPKIDFEAIISDVCMDFNPVLAF